MVLIPSYGKEWAPSTSNAVPADLDVQLIVDNYSSHKHAKVRTWLPAKPRFHLHFMPTYSSWLNQVERWFGLITQQAIRRGSFKSVKKLIAKNSTNSSCTTTANPNPSRGPPLRTPSSRNSPDYVIIFLGQHTMDLIVDGLANGRAVRSLSAVDAWRWRPYQPGQRTCDAALGSANGGQIYSTINLNRETPAMSG